MRPARKALEFLYTTAAILISGIAYAYSTGFYTCWPLAWLAPLPILVYSFYHKPLPSVVVAFLAFFLGGISGIGFYAHTLLPTVKPLLFSLILSSALFSLLILWVRVNVIRFRHWLTILVFPCSFVLYEYLGSISSTAGNIDSLAYSQITNLAVSQIAALTGSWGISFLLCLLPSTLAVAWYLKTSGKVVWPAFLFTLGLLLLVYLYGEFVLHKPRQVPSVKLGMIAVPASLKDLKTLDKDHALAITGQYVEQINSLASQGAQIIVLPEKILPLDASFEGQILQIFANVAKSQNLMLVLGLKQFSGQHKINKAVFIDRGSILPAYVKQHLLPGPESNFLIGQSLLIHRTTFGTLGVAICKDMDFIRPALNYSQQGVGLMLVPALDFVLDGWLHAKPAIMRGIEGGYTVARAGQWGLLSVSDAQGRILAMTKTSGQRVVSLVATVPIGSGHTWYSKLGNWFVLVCGLIFLVNIIFLNLKRKSLVKV